MQIRVEYKIYEERRRKKMSLRDLAEKSGISKSQISRIENGEMHPTVYTLCLIAIALEESPYKLFQVSLIRDK